MSQQRENVATEKTIDTKECPLCAETIKAIAKKCPHCSQAQPPLRWGERGETKISSKIKRSLFWIEWFSEWVSYTLGRWALLEIFTRASIIAVVVLFILGIPGQIQQRQNTAWQVVFLSSQTGGGEATVNALEELHKGPLGLPDGILGLLSGANFSGINLPKTSLIGVELPEANLNGANLSKADLYFATLSRASLYDANLSGANLSRANLSGASLFGADLSGASLERADLSGVWLMSDANLSGANLEGANLSGANLLAANLSGADLIGADLSGASLLGADLSGASLFSANLNEADLREAEYDKDTIWPKGFDPEQAGAKLVE